MTYQFDILTKNRALILKLVDGFSLKQLNEIPEGFSNNIVWNIAHLVVIQQLLCYKMSGLSISISEEMVSKYSKGTKPERWVSEADFLEIKELLVHLPVQFEKDYRVGVFKTFEPYTTSVNVTLTDIESAFAFNNFHEGIHLGVILALRKLV
jgi:hypothetical protein